VQAISKATGVQVQMPQRQYADGGIARGPESGYTATLHGAEAVVPLPDGNTIPVKFEAPTKEQLKQIYSDLTGLIPGLVAGQDDRSFAVKSGSIADQLSMAVTEAIKTQPNLGLTAAQPGEQRDIYDFVKMMLSTPEGKVFAAQNMVGVEGMGGAQSEESQRLRQQYAMIQEQLKTQDLAAVRAGKMTGGSIEDPLSRMEVLAEDYAQRQALRTERGFGDAQTGDSRDERLVESNQQVIQVLQELVALQRSQNSTSSKILQASTN